MTRSTAICIVGLAVVTLAGSPQVCAQETLGESGVKGAGSTFVYPVLSRWSRDYRAARARSQYPVADGGLDDPTPSTMLQYEPVGSLGGMLRVKGRAVDFGISDMPMRPAALAAVGLVQFPIVIGGIVIAVNVEGVGNEQLRLSGAMLADIFLGKITRWSDPAIAAQNAQLKLPDAQIVVTHRADGSGTTFNFSEYLAMTSPEWSARVGSGFLLKWPTGKAARGNEGVAQLIAATRNSIGYVEASRAADTRLSTVLIQNLNGRFVRPDRAGFEAAAALAEWGTTTDFYRVLANAGGPAAYPLTTAVFVMVPKSAARARTQATLDFFRWVLDRGANTAVQLGYAPIPAVLAQQIKTYWSRTLK